jgi:hypothetical protein
MKDWYLTGVNQEKELAENCCGSGTGTVQGPRGKVMSAVGSCYQRNGEDTAD